ncbi:MAG: hypothetical protein MSA09_14880 [Lachnospiraceae bacterium]|nr:hypothetical protein [Lachnospiraceae bacterium]MDD7176877.1 hypothetical protein [bacterium]MDY5517598.1 hypothetical protein [Lachnospiraceae bacterium]
MKQKWDVTISKTGLIEVFAENKEEAAQIADCTEIEKQIFWEDSWSVVDVQESN